MLTKLFFFKCSYSTEVKKYMCAHVWMHVHMWGARADLVLEDTGFPVDDCGVLEPC